MRIIFAVLLAVLLTPALGIAGGNTTNDSFNKAKKSLERQVYYDHRITLYCGARFDDKKNVYLPEGFLAPAHEKRSAKVEWEHAVPTENFGRAFSEWRNGDPQCVDNRGQKFKGRKCAEKMSMEYRYMQSDMYNLFPAIGSVNAVRSNLQYGQIPGRHSDFGTCEAKVGNNRFEPPNRAKGQVARAALYMEESYPRFHLSSQQRQLFKIWNQLYPVDAWECSRARRIEKIQGNANKFVKEPCQKLGLWRN